MPRRSDTYYPCETDADELWDPYYVEACRELDAEFPAAQLLPDSYSLRLSASMIKKLEEEACTST